MHDTQLNSWKEILPKLPDKRREVLEVLLYNPDGMTTYEIARYMGREIHEISGRITELQYMGIVRDTGKKINPKTRKPCNIWIAKNTGRLF
jgi:predicted transcriptional regulator